MFAPAFGLVIAVAVLSAEVEPAATEIDGDWQLVSIRWDGREELETKSVKKWEEKLGKEVVAVHLEKGKWTMSAHREQGKEPSPDAEESQDSDEVPKIEYQLDPGAAPKQIDWSFQDADDEKPRKYEAIYRVKDDDLAVCFSLTDDPAGGEDIFDNGKGPYYEMAQSPRPTTFDPARQTIWTFKRVPAVKESR